ncbi:MULTISPECIES: FAD binding domain-containing protein [unclassified Clostridium]|uniref:FAD binding domain-containing protein n=1 Tax=unclassified Clostridium TaxID=2614128 RepID=UPI0032171026
MLKIYSPKTIEEVKEYMKDHSNLKLLAGGTDLVLDFKRNKVKCESIVSLEKISDLKKIVDDKDEIYIGAMVTFSDLIENNIIKDYCNLLLNCSMSMGSPQIRNVATVGGNIANGGSAADIIPCIISLGGVLLIESEEAIRRVSCEEYFENYKEERLKENEILTHIIIPKTQNISGYYKLGKRNSLAISRVSAAVNLEIKKDRICAINICLGAVGRYPFRAKELEERSLGKDIKWLYSEEALEYLESIVEKSIEGRKTMPFKREAIKGVFKRALDNALQQ